MAAPLQPSTSIALKFRAMFGNFDAPNLPYEKLTMPLFRELLQCLHPSNIPCAPFDEGSLHATGSGIDSLHVYSRLLGDLHLLPLVMQRELIKWFPLVWQWIRFLSPRYGHFSDDEVQIVQAHKQCHLQADGRFAMASHARVHIMNIMVTHAQRTAEGTRALLTCPGLTGDILSMLTMLCPLQPEPQLAQGQHLLAKLFLGLHARGRGFSPNPAQEGLVEFDSSHPGKVLRSVVKRSIWILIPGSGAAPSFDADYVDTYITLLDTILLRDASFIANFRRSTSIGPPVLALERISRMIELHALEAEPYKHRALGALVKILAAHLVPTAENPSVLLADVVHAIKCGFVPVLHYLVMAVSYPSAHPRRGDAPFSDTLWRDTRDIIAKAVVPSLVWRSALRAAYDSEDIVALFDLDENDPVLQLPDWDILHRSFWFFANARETYKELDAAHCCNMKCPNRDTPMPSRMKTCSCGSAFYCSRACQKIDWHASHHQSCARTNEGPVKTRPRSRGPYVDAPNCISHSMRTYLKICANQLLAQLGDPTAVHRVHTILVDFVNVDMNLDDEDGRPGLPSIVYGALDRKPGFVPASPVVPDSTLVHVWVLVAKGGTEYMMEVDSVPREQFSRWAETRTHEVK
ncbi:uncharacterized protein SCHCODRAFT_02690774 [Schizophyllum commune H4-8]|nr:uncharacterized protein SCHCODRAFT_02690774 [Schizophyllum commune H4-8]KAI5888923.1 hypothetical protein SCHCODRAFT_02690774 [Schizophyllum commune H4-8]